MMLLLSFRRVMNGLLGLAGFCCSLWFSARVLSGFVPLVVLWVQRARSSSCGVKPCDRWHGLIFKYGSFICSPRFELAVSQATFSRFLFWPLPFRRWRVCVGFQHTFTRDKRRGFRAFCGFFCGSCCVYCGAF